jgi:aminomethyltransferase
MAQEKISPKIFPGGHIRKSPYYAATERYGCRVYITYNHMYMPLIFEGTVADYWRLVNDVALWDVACERQVEITGPDAFRFVQLLTPRNLSRCAIGQCKYVVITDENGGIINDPVLLRLSENHFWLSIADQDVMLWAKGVAVHSGLDVTICEPDVSPLAIQGPKAVAVTVDLFGDWVKELRYFRFRETDLNGIPLILARTGWSKQGGFELFLRDGRRGDELWETVMAAGKPYNIGPGAPSTIERLEGGLLNYGTDMTTENNPFELGLDKFVDLDQEADFIGKEALLRIKTEGIKKRLVGLEIAGDRLPGMKDSWPVRHNGEPSGMLTSVTYSPRLKKNIALAMISMPNSNPGTTLLVDSSVGTAMAMVVPIPFVQPNT